MITYALIGTIVIQMIFIFIQRWQIRKLFNNIERFEKLVNEVTTHINIGETRKDDVMSLVDLVKNMDNK